MSPRKIAYQWRPIEAPASAAGLASPEIRALTTLWQRQKARLVELSALDRFTERMARWWSIETGILERLYDLSQGATHTFVEQGFVASLLSHGDTNISPDLLIAILNDHRESLTMVKDLIGGTRPLSNGWIRELHALMTRNQHEVDAITPDGRYIKVPLRHGEYKRVSNNPIRPDEALHEYCPPEQTASEMERLIEIYHSLPAELSEVRAAWLHHAFTQIHPFQDGNGRVARALASIDLIRAGLFPLLIERGDKTTRYIPALEAADRSDLKPLVDLFAKCMERALIRAISEAENVVGAAQDFADVLRAGAKKQAFRASQAQHLSKSAAKRLGRLAETTHAVLAAAGQQIESELADIQARASCSEPSTAHYFRRQVVFLARRHNYWADLHAERAWARLRLLDGGTTDLVVTFHFIGNPSPGACVADVFLEHRVNSIEEVEEPIYLPLEPLLLTIDEDEALQLERLKQWLEQVKIQGTVQWLKFL